MISTYVYFFQLQEGKCCFWPGTDQSLREALSAFPRACCSRDKKYALIQHACACTTLTHINGTPKSPFARLTDTLADDTCAPAPRVISCLAARCQSLTLLKHICSYYDFDSNKVTSRTSFTLP